MQNVPTYYKISYVHIYFVCLIYKYLPITLNLSIIINAKVTLFFIISRIKFRNDYLFIYFILSKFSMVIA